MKEEIKATNVKTEDGSSVEQIKNLIFGAEIRLFKEQFTILEKQLDDQKRLFDKKIQLLSEEIAGNLSNLDASFQAKLKTNQTQVLKEIKKLTEEKADRKVLKKALQKMAEEV